MRIYQRSHVYGKDWSQEHRLGVMPDMRLARILRCCPKTVRKWRLKLGRKRPDPMVSVSFRVPFKLWRQAQLSAKHSRRSFSKWMRDAMQVRLNR